MKKTASDSTPLLKERNDTSAIIAHLRGYGSASSLEKVNSIAYTPKEGAKFSANVISAFNYQLEFARQQEEYELSPKGKRPNSDSHATPAMVIGSFISNLEQKDITITSMLLDTIRSDLTRRILEQKSTIATGLTTHIFREVDSAFENLKAQHTHVSTP